MSGANASPTRSASATARSLKEGRSDQKMSGANASPTRSASATARSLKEGRSDQKMTTKTEMNDMSRREFLSATAAVGGAMVLGFWLPPESAQAQAAVAAD